MNILQQKKDTELKQYLLLFDRTNGSTNNELKLELYYSNNIHKLHKVLINNNMLSDDGESFSSMNDEKTIMIEFLSAKEIMERLLSDPDAAQTNTTAKLVIYKLLCIHPILKHMYGISTAVITPN